MTSALTASSPFAHSLDNNGLSGLNRYGGAYDAESITALCEGLKGSALTALR